jgi:thiol:disulfide interchange protein DsbD
MSLTEPLRRGLHVVMRTCLPLLAASLAACASASAVAQVPGATPAPVLAPALGALVRTDQVRAELLAHAPEGLAPGRPAWLGLRLDHAPGWHSYWKNPGDSGLPTTLEWTLPPGFQTGEIAWPTPRPLPLGTLVNYGYEGRLLLAVPLQVPAGFDGRSVPVRLRAQWLVCKDVCIPEEGEFALELPGRAAITAAAADFEVARAALPRPVPAAEAGARIEAGALEVRVRGLPAAWTGQALRFLPETPEVIDNAARVTQRWQGDTWLARVSLSAQRTAAPAQMPVVLARDGEAAGVQLRLPVEGPWPAAAAAPAPTAPAAPLQTAALGWAAALLLALVGGALLNLMPCVFPVLSLKVVGFAAHAQDRRALLASGLAYTAGVIASFLALAALLLALRAGGEQLGWGFQLQSPAFVAALAALFTLIGLNLAGVFEFGSVLPGSLAALRARHPVADSALTGVLAVAVASPCTAPFMGASLGLAVTLPTAQALAVFAALGLGMALPYLAASAWPALARALPRPGPWMAHFKAVMAFPMFATVIWLVWVLGQQAGIDAVAAWLGTLLALGFAAWVAGVPGLGRRARAAWGLAAALLLGAALAWSVPALVAPGASAPAAAGMGAGAADRWQPWSPERVRQALAEGRPVFVDFTAAWCVTCQFNKRTVLSDAGVLADFEARRVLLLRADWTRRDPAITAALAAHGRNGVPVYLLHAPRAPEPRLLGEILSVDEVRAALAALP